MKTNLLKIVSVLVVVISILFVNVYAAEEGANSDNSNDVYFQSEIADEEENEDTEFIDGLFEEPAEQANFDDDEIEIDTIELSESPEGNYEENYFFESADTNASSAVIDAVLQEAIELLGETSLNYLVVYYTVNICGYGYTTNGNAVALLQRALMSLGYYYSSIDYNFGPYTYQAVINFQSAYGLTVDGLCGPGTWGTLLSVCSTAFGASTVKSWAQTYGCYTAERFGPSILFYRIGSSNNNWYSRTY